MSGDGFLQNEQEQRVYQIWNIPEKDTIFAFLWFEAQQYYPPSTATKKWLMRIVANILMQTGIKTKIPGNRTVSKSYAALSERACIDPKSRPHAKTILQEILGDLKWEYT